MGTEEKDQRRTKQEMSEEEDLRHLVEREERYARGAAERAKRRWQRRVAEFSIWIGLSLSLVVGHIFSTFERAGSADRAFERFIDSNATLPLALGFLLVAIYSKLHTVVEQIEEFLAIKRKLFEDKDMRPDAPLLFRIRDRLKSI